jgi:hypothetical protein
MEKTNKRVVLLEDNEEHFNKITAILKNMGCEIVLEYDKVITLMTNYDAYKTSSPTYKNRHKTSVQETRDLIPDDCWWLIDVNWTGQPKETYADEYGLDFHADFRIAAEKTIILSVNPKEKYRTAVNGLVYISKEDDRGTLFTDTFEKNLLKVLLLDVIPVQESPY